MPSKTPPAVEVDFFELQDLEDMFLPPSPSFKHVGVREAEDVAGPSKTHPAVEDSQFSGQGVRGPVSGPSRDPSPVVQAVPQEVN